MRVAVALGLLGVSLVLDGCSDDYNEGPADVPGPAPAEVAATQFYDAAAQRDCITMRGLSTPDEQREDDAWADCIDVMLEVAGDDFDYRLGDPEVGEDRVTYTVSSSSVVDGEPVARQDALVLVYDQERWAVDDSVVTAGA